MNFELLQTNKLKVLLNVILKLFYFQSAGCVLHALCFHRSPFDAVVERGDSPALAAMSYKFKDAPLKHS